MRILIFIVFLVAAAGMMAYLMKTRNETSVTSMKNKVQENIQNPEHLKDMPEGDEDEEKN
jgi:hypothetical protein